MQPSYTQNISHQLASYPQSYVTGTPISDLTYQYPGFLNNYTYPYQPNNTRINTGSHYGVSSVPYGGNLYVTSTPGYTSSQGISGHSAHQTVFSREDITTNRHHLRHSNSTGSLGANVVTHGPGIATAQQLGAIGLQGYSQIQYVPYQSYYIDYEQQQFVQNIVVPVQKKVTDYYAVEHVVDYVPKEIQETVIDMVPQEKVTEKLYYVPVQTQMIHMPKDQHVVHNHGQKITTEVREQRVINSGSQVGQNRIVSRPVERVVTGGTVPTVQVRPPPPPVATQTVVQRPANTIPVPVPTQTPQIRPPIAVGPGQFIQRQEILQANQAQVQKQLNLPQDAKMQYQYSTRTVRTLAPGQVPSQPTTTIGQPTATLPNSVPAQFQPVLSKLAPVTTTQINQRVLSNNKGVDLADSQHINITKSVYNATYNNPGPSVSAGQPSNFSFGTGNANRGSATSNQTFGVANRSSGGFNPAVVNVVDPLANRISGGSVYDYDQLRDY